MKTEVNVPEGKEILVFTPSYELILLKQGRHKVKYLSIQTPHESQSIFIIRTLAQEQFKIANEYQGATLGKRKANKKLAKLIHNLTQEKSEIKKVYQNDLNKENLESSSGAGYQPIYSLRDGVLSFMMIPKLEEDPMEPDYVVLHEGKQILTLIEFWYKAFVTDKTAFKEYEDSEYHEAAEIYNALVLFNTQVIIDIIVPLLVFETKNSKLTSYYEEYEKQIQEVNKALGDYIEKYYCNPDKNQNVLKRFKNSNTDI